ncbi:MAG: sensor histidine kinase, partial [Bradymonadaceae bacterium]
DVTAPEEAWVRADEALPLAVQSLLENAVVHNDDPSPTVEIDVTVDSDAVRLAVADDGPGLTRLEEQIFEQRSIDPLNHSTGLGLWLVNWVARNSQADVDIDSADTGTTITLSLERGFDRSEIVPAADRSEV